MIIEDETKTSMCAIAIKFGPELVITQGCDAIIIDQQQAAQLFEVLQRWIDGEEVE